MMKVAHEVRFEQLDGRKREAYGIMLDVAAGVDADRALVAAYGAFGPSWVVACQFASQSRDRSV